MKKALIALAVLGLTGGAAVAQSSVTLFGVVDADMRYVKTGDLTMKRLESGGLNTSRLGVRGTEDLGGGLKAGFWLESQVNVDTGTADAKAFWGRRSTVSLMGDFGEVRLGRYKTATRLHIEDFDPYSGTGLGDVTKVYSTLGSQVDTFTRADNMVAYVLPSNLGGVYGEVDVAAGEGVVGKKMQAARVGYQQGPLNVGVAFQSAVGVGNQRYKLGSLGAAYDFGVVRPSFNVSQTKFGDAKQSIYTFAVTAPLGQGQVLGSFTQSKANDAAKALLTAKVDDAKLFVLGYVYNVSKRTALYTTYAQIQNDGNGVFTVASAPAATAGGQKSSGFDVGIRHSF